MSLRRRVSLGFPATALLATVLLAACFPDPPASLRSVMIEQELVVTALEKGGETAEPAELASLAREIDTLSRSEAFERYERRSAVSGRVAEFRALRDRYRSEGTALLGAADRADRAALTEALTRLRGTCDGCHAQFRPGL